MSICCCKDCADRTAEDEHGRNCHTYCEKYLAQVEEHKKEKVELKRKREYQRVYDGYIGRVMSQSRKIARIQ